MLKPNYKQGEHLVTLQHAKLFKNAVTMILIAVPILKIDFFARVWA